MRGQAEATVRRHRLKWITPADAGTSTGDSLGLLMSEDHPRGCGDKFDTFPGKLPGTGSPPRMRGQVSAVSMSQPDIGITPADAGTRRVRQIICISFRDPPRGCGDKHQSDSMRFVVWGSPPRMRGQVSLIRCRSMSLRITPADAGTSNIWSWRIQYDRITPADAGTRLRLS